MLVKAVLFTLPLFVMLSSARAAEVSEKKPNASSQQQRALYVLGPEDQITIWALGVEDISDKPVRVDFQGFIDLPLVGRIKAAGKTITELRGELINALRREVKEPQVTINVVEFRSQPVSVVGAVNSPGLHQLQGRKTLMEMLSLAGGLRPEAGYSVKITRRSEWGPIPLPDATPTATGEFTVAEVKLKSLMEAANPDQNIAIFPNDVISVPRAELYYVLGDVKKAGGFVLGENKTISVLQALSTAEGLSNTAAPKNARILRSVPGSSERTETAVNLKRIVDGKDKDIQLNASDILYVPSSFAKKISTRTIEAGVSLGTGLLIWR